MLNFNQTNKGQDGFVWDVDRELVNIHKHGLDFSTAVQVFKDLKRKVYVDSRHSEKEERLFCIGKVGIRIITVRFTYRGDKIKIFGAGYWRKGRVYYEKKD